jgi:hypothetical protein
MTEVSIDQLQTAVERMHDCAATYRKPVQINEEFQGQTVWTGTVYEFDVDHPHAKTCYAWTATIDGSDKRKFYAVLGIAPVNSAKDAVRASIIADMR